MADVVQDVVDGSGGGPSVIDAEPQVTAIVRGVVPMAELPDFFDKAFGELGEVLAGQGVTPTGAAFALYHGQPTDTVDLEVGLPTDRPVTPVGRVDVGGLPGGKVATAVHSGSFDGLSGAWASLAAWVASQGLTPDSTIWEVYLTEPRPDMDPSELRTQLYWLMA